MGKNKGLLPGVLGGVLGAAALSGYIYYLRPRMLRWGAGDDEVGAALSGDELVSGAKLVSTNAVTIEAPSYRVWPWLVQIGQGRGGFYSYDWLENLFGLNIHSADRVLAQYQHLTTGDVIPLAPNGMGLTVARLEQDRALVLHGDTRRDAAAARRMGLRPGDYLAFSWGFYLFDLAKGVTRLVDRWKADWSPSLLNSVLYRALVEPAGFVMRQGMLSGLKARAEGRIAWRLADDGES